METYNATIELEARGALTDDQVDELMEQLAGYHAAIGHTPRRHSVTISLPAENLRQAVTTALAVVEAAFGSPALTIEAMTTAEFDTREGWQPVPELVSVAEAAEILGVSRQAVLQRIGTRSLPAEKVGRGYAIPRTALTPPQR